MAPETRDVIIKQHGGHNSRAWNSFVSVCSLHWKLRVQVLVFFFFLPLHELFVRKLNLVTMCSCVAKRFVMCMQLKMVLLANYNVICAYQEMFPFV